MGMFDTNTACVRSRSKPLSPSWMRSQSRGAIDANFRRFKVLSLERILMAPYTPKVLSAPIDTPLTRSQERFRPSAL